MSSSQPGRQRQDVAPFLTHVVTHHGQLTLVPPQNAGRIRKSTKRKKQSSNKERDEEEPRFTTAVPLSSSRKLHQAPVVRARKHAISTSTPPASPSTSRRFELLPESQLVPDYPPPSFEDAIAESHVPPLLSSLPDQCVTGPESDQPSTQASRPMMPSPTSSSTLMPISAAASVVHGFPAASPMMHSKSVDPPPHPARSTSAAPSPLAVSSTTTRCDASPVTPVSTVLSDMPLLQPPPFRPVPQPDVPQSGLPPCEPSPGAPYRLTSPSTTTLFSPTHAVRVPPAVPHAVHIPLPRTPSPEPDSAVAEVSPSPPASPYSPSRASDATATDIFEEFTWEPRQRWSADRRLGLSLEERVQREFERRKTEEALTAFVGGSAEEPVDPRTRLCHHCGSHRPLNSGDIQSINEESEEDIDDDDVSELSRESPSSTRTKGKSPYLHPFSSPSMAKIMSHSKSTLLLKPQSPESASPTSTMPTSPHGSTSFFKMSSAWASNVTLSLSTAIGHGHNADKGPASSSETFGPNKTLKRRESFGVKRLFGSLKGKERERDHVRSHSVPNTPIIPAIHPESNARSSSDSSVAEGWEVVSVEASNSTHSSHSTPSSRSTSASTAPTSPSHSIPESVNDSPIASASSHPLLPSPTTSPTSEGSYPAFLNRPLRPRTGPGILDSLVTPTSSPPSTPRTLTPAMLPPPTPTSARPYLPEKSLLRRLASTNQARIQTQTLAPSANHVTFPSVVPATPISSAVSLGTPITPRTPRPTPSVVWKVPSPTGRSPLAQPPSSPLAMTSGGPFTPTSPVVSPLVHPSISILTRSEKSALRHQSVPTPCRLSDYSQEYQVAAPVAKPLSIAPRDGQVHLRRRRAATPPPSHRRAIVSCEARPLSDLASYEDVDFAATWVLNEVEEEVQETVTPGPVILEPSASTEQLIAAEEGRATPDQLSPVAPVCAPVTFPAVLDASSSHTSQSSHYPGRPLPSVPAEPVVSTPVKRVPDGYPVARLPEANYGRPPHAQTFMPAPSTPLLTRATPPSPQTVPRSVPALESPMVSEMERTESGGSILEDAQPAEEGAPSRFLPVTDLDVLAARVFDGPVDGRHYEDLLLVSEVIGSAAGPRSKPRKSGNVPYTGVVEVTRRRVLKDGRVKVKMALLGVPVSSCTICQSQFRREERAALAPTCKHPAITSPPSRPPHSIHPPSCNLPRITITMLHPLLATHHRLPCTSSSRQGLVALPIGPAGRDRLFLFALLILVVEYSVGEPVSHITACAVRCGFLGPDHKRAVLNGERGKNGSVNASDPTDQASLPILYHKNPPLDKSGCEPLGALESSVKYARASYNHKHHSDIEADAGRMKR
ncbi:uncharacterized protein BXZ73DRAFT_77917 [Epithele typhae]|uniref:uncharacterized protein n=1 Tax=Epithele typhae TaxID=378194 RepID=UPI002007E6D2|nr:uncharacterized protein BXZ73DRAFT_77917 [Epithele typhae]KAH9930473.1 hypothetical protein BXZ73DRAFT_77917 [Epithele typhae]